MATRVAYHGDTSLAMRYKGHADILLESLRKSITTLPSSISHTFADGTKITVCCATKELESIDIWAKSGTTKDKYVWTLLYAPCPLPDPQDWPGWFECDIEDLMADGPNNEFLLLSWGNPFYGDFTTEDDVTPVTTYPSDSSEDGGWYINGAAYSSVMPLYIGMTQYHLGVERLGQQRVGNTCTYTFPNNLFQSAILENYTITGSKHWCGGGWPTEPDGFVYIPSNAYGVPPPPDLVLTHVIGSYDPGYTLVHSEGYISWESLYSIGFWKWELIAYTPSSYLDADNYAGFFEKYTYDSSSSNTYLADQGAAIIRDIDAFAHHGGQSWTEQMADDYVTATGGDGDHVSFDYTVTYSGGAFDTINVLIHDPDSTNGTASKVTIEYETHFCGKYEGVFFDDTIGTATWTGYITTPTGHVGSWSGDNIFPWMARIYDKNVLLTGDEGQEQPSDHHLLIASWLRGTPDGNVSSTLVVPGCSAGIDKVTYIARHGSTYTSKEYSASHPGWHDVYTNENGRTWRAYGDLFAALKKVEGV